MSMTTQPAPASALPPHPTPWNFLGAGIVVDANRKRVFVADDSMEAIRILERVNSHAALVEALRSADSLFCESDIPDRFPEAYAVMAKIRAALENEH